ncbi:hypothetical protein CPLU01_07458 [Colletotrichum plurivorum]|uniref:Uncharacterized protein n=1 Tax=Colletotrichum plurivorum TaxID=2175906 RepID=A0A8H6NEV6_9PEZI|nr:hypothetical protein CPLU01_07458 [Colletotrichum plurivorum]
MRDRRRVTPQPDRDKDLGNRHSEGKEYSHPVGTTAPSATRGGRQHRGPLVSGLGLWEGDGLAGLLARQRTLFSSNCQLSSRPSQGQPRGLLRPPVTYWVVGRETSVVESWGRQSWKSGRCREALPAPPRSPWQHVDV